MDCGSSDLDPKSPVSKSAERSAGRDHRVVVVPPSVQQSEPIQPRRLVDWSTVASPNVRSPNVRSPEVPGIFNMKDIKSEVLSHVQGVGEGVTLIVRSEEGRESSEENPFHMDDMAPEMSNSSDTGREASQEEADSETAAGGGDLGQPGVLTLPFELPTCPVNLSGKLESIYEEEEGAPGGLESDLGTPCSDLSRIEERRRRWSTGEVGPDLASPDGGLNRVRRSLEDVRLALSPAGSSPRLDDSKDPRSYFSNRVWQKLEHLEHRINKIEVKFFESIDLVQIHVEEQLAEHRSHEERARKEFTELLVSALDSQHKAFSGGLTELQVVHGTVPRDASTGGTANPPATVMCPVDRANVLGVAQDYAVHTMHAAELLDAHRTISSELEGKLKALQSLGSGPDCWDTKFDEMSQLFEKSISGQCPTSIMKPSQESVSPLRPSNGDESDFGKAINFHEVKYGTVPSERPPEERKKVSREDSEVGHAGEEDIASEGAIFTLRTPVKTVLHSGNYVSLPQEPQPMLAPLGAITL